MAGKNPIVALSLCLFALTAPRNATSQTVRQYSKEDSTKAAAYFKRSWNFPIGTSAHQKYLDSALLIIPANAYYWQQKSMPFYKSGKFEIGRPFLDSAVKYDPGRWLEYRAFMKCIYEKDYGGALSDLYAVRTAYGNRVVMDHSYNFYIGLCHLQRTSFDSAEYYLTGCIDADIKAMGEKWVHANHYFYLAVVYMAKEDYAKAVTCFDKAVGAYPNFSDARYYKALCLANLGKNKEALVEMEQANTSFQAGYTLVEDNALHVDYPYQVRKAYYPAALEDMRNGLDKGSK